MFEFLEQYEELTISEQKVLKYILKHIDEIPHLQINELASNAFVSKTVVINLAQKLGFDGFKELKYHINSQLLQNKRDWKPKENSIKDQLTEDITKTLSLINERDINSCGKILLQSRNIFIMARGTSKSVGYYLEHLLFSLGLHCFFIDDYNLSESGKLQYQMHNFFKKFNHINDLTRKPDTLMNIAFSNSISNLYFNCYH